MAYASFGAIDLARYLLERWGDKVQIAIVAAPNETGNLEAYVDPMQAGFISGKAIITAHLPPGDPGHARARCQNRIHGWHHRKATLSSADLAQALKAPVTAVELHPGGQSGRRDHLTRFGQPAERVRSNGHLEHFLYPDKGLDLALDSEGKELLQYVAPVEFERLRQPLLNAAASRLGARLRPLRACSRIIWPGNGP